MARDPQPPRGKRQLPRTREPFARLTLSLPRRQVAQLRADAGGLGLSLSEFVRRVLDQPSSRPAPREVPR